MVDDRILVTVLTEEGRACRRILEEAGFEIWAAEGLENLARELRRGGGAVLLEEEALTEPFRAVLHQVLAEQPEWSDLAIVLLTQGTPTAAAATLAGTWAGNFILLDRPVPLLTLVSTLHACLRNRRRQYQRRDALAELSRSEATLREERNRLQAILDHSPAVIFLKDRDGLFTLVNREMERVFATPAAEFPGRTVRDFLPPDQGDRVAANDRQVLARNRPFEFEEVLDLPDGRHIFRSIKFPLRDGAGKAYGLCGISTDMTRARLAERERERLLAELEATFQAIADGIVIFGPQGEIVQMNPAAESFFGPTTTYRPGSLDQLHADMNPENPDGTGLRAEDSPVLNALGGDTVRGRIFAISPPGQGRRWISVSAAPIRIGGGPVRGAVATYTDITPLQELQRHREALSHSISHDLRLPLTVILGHAELLQAGRRAGAPAQEVLSVDAIHHAAERMKGLIDDLVEMARLEGGRLLLQKSAVSLAERLAELMAIAGMALPVERLDLDLPADLPEVVADPRALERILLNLLSNAFKYSPADSRVTLSARMQQHWVVVSVRDRGCGLSPEVQGKVFQPFVRCQRGDSVGLGLYIARMLVEAHGGRIWVESEAAGGTTFHFSLPGPGTPP